MQNRVAEGFLALSFVLSLVAQEVAHNPLALAVGLGNPADFGFVEEEIVVDLFVVQPLALTGFELFYRRIDAFSA